MLRSNASKEGSLKELRKISGEPPDHFDKLDTKIVPPIQTHTHTHMSHLSLSAAPSGLPYLTIMKTAIDQYLPLSDVASQIRDRMRDVVIGHCEDRELSDRAITSFDTASTLIDGRQIRVPAKRTDGYCMIYRACR